MNHLNNLQRCSLALIGLVFFLSSFSLPQPQGGITSSFWKSFKDGNVNIYTLKDAYSNSMGHAIWMSRAKKRMKAAYFSTGEVYNKQQRWSRGKDVFLTCSGAFSDDLDVRDGALPVGINVEQGMIKNRTVVKEGMDALVVVYASGGIVVSDLTKGDLYLQSVDKTIDVRSDITAKYDLLEWAETEKATIFQTQLLAYKDQLKIDSRGRKQKRERRFLALATSKKGALYHIIFNLPKGVYLYDGAKDVLEHLQDQGMKVTALLNLDTGAYNVLDLDSGDYTVDKSIKGKIGVHKAVNLLSYHYD